MTPDIESKLPNNGHILHQDYAELRNELSKLIQRSLRKRGREAELLPMRDLPAYSLYSTTLDLSRFIRMLLGRGVIDGKRILKLSTVEEMFEVQNSDVPLDLTVRNGLGWFLEQDSILGGGYVVRHGGTTLLFASELIILPEHRLGVIVLANTADSRAIVSELAVEILQRVVDAREGIRPAATGDFLAEMPDSATDFEPIASEGRYATDLGLIAIRPKDEKLCACIVEKTLDLIPFPEGWFGVRKSSVDSLPPLYQVFGELRFATRIIDGRTVIVARRGTQEILLGEKVPLEPVPDKWLQRVGKYELLNPDEKFPLEVPEVWYKHDMLGMSYKLPLLSQRTIRVPLRPISDKSCSPFTPLLGVTLAASVIIIGGCASSGQLPRQPGIGDEGMDLLSEKQSSIDDMRDARLRRKGLSVVRGADNRVQGYQVYTHGRDWGTPIGH